MTFNPGDRVTNGVAEGTVEGVFGQYVWVLPDNQVQPKTFLETDLTIVVDPAKVFEVGKSYSMPKNANIYTIVFQIDTNTFIAWVRTPEGGNSSTTVTNDQRDKVVEL